MAVSNLKAFGTPLTEEYQQAMDDYLANPKRYLSTKTDSYARFVSTNTQSEALIKATTNLSLSTSAIGVSLGSGSTNNFKFGLTSTNFVIHYEIVENGYRTLGYNALNNAWQEKGFLPFVENLEKGSDSKFPTAFRDLFGDYYVSGYQYGACYDAYISITTETSEQIKEVENRLTAELSLGDGQFNASADVKNSLKNTFQNAKATVTIKVVTNGLDFKAPKVAVITSADMASGYDKATAQIGDSLTQFIQAVNSNSDRSKFAPIRVKLDRWFGFFPLMMIMYNRGYRGSIPLTVNQVGTIRAFNSQLKALTGHVNVVADNPNINSSSRTDIEADYNRIIGVVKAGGEQFYKSDADVKKYTAEVKALTPKFKALSDRYVFYTKLKLAQQAEKKIYDDLKAKADALPEGDNREYVRKMPFGSERGGSTGYEQFGVSEYVTDDIEAGKKIHKQYQRNRDDQNRIEWHANHPKDHIDYLSSAGDATITAEVSGDANAKAVFCYVKFLSCADNNKDDRKRELADGAPAVGKSSVGFEVKSGYGDDVNWNLYGTSIKMTPKDYPFQGLE